MHSGVEDYFAQLTASVKIDFGLEMKSLLKCPFLTVFIKIYRPTKLGTFFGFNLGYLKVTPYVPKLAAKLTSKYIYQGVFTNLPAI